MTSSVGNYIGRFAPTPSGALHAGSLLTAVASYLDAKHHGGTWLVRIEDVDQQRCLAGAESDILRTLERFGLEWDKPPVRQSERSPEYRQRLFELSHQHISDHTLYPCYCSRKDLTPSQGRYAGTCRNRSFPFEDWPMARNMSSPAFAVRWRMPDQSINFEDRCTGHVFLQPSHCFGDPVVLRKDGFFAYHWATVIDDWLQGVTHIVRGRDLLDQTGIHILLQQAFKAPQPFYAHLPLVVSTDGKKLSKSERAASLSGRPQTLLLKVLNQLNQPVPSALMEDKTATVSEILATATQTWSITHIPTTPVITLSEPTTCQP